MPSIYILYELYHMKVLFYSNNSYQVLCKQHLQQNSPTWKKESCYIQPHKRESVSIIFFVMKLVYFYLSIVISIPAVTYPFKED